jgi:epoxyqueuosine reductase
VPARGEASLAVAPSAETTARLIVERAHELGFERAGIVALEPPRHLEELRRWLALGRHGEMAYMARHQEVRADPRRLRPGASSAVVVAMSHRPADDDGRPGGFARYARGSDYHRLIRRRLAELGRFVEGELGGGAAVAPRAFTDSAPILERDLAQRAGLGWLGKSANVIDQELGSYLFLGELLVGRELPSLTRSAPDRCGTCTACLEACPTGAIVAPFEVDARRCISYLTIELRGPIPQELRPLVGDHLFGCDICQLVCPWNGKAPPLSEAAFRPRPELLGLSAAAVLRLDEREFDRIFAGMAVRRAGRAGLARNAAVVLGNAGDGRALPDLVAALREDPSALVRGHAAWALGRLGGESARAALELARLREPEADVGAEIAAALEGG